MESKEAPENTFSWEYKFAEKTENYTFYYSINNAKEHPITNGEIRVFKTIQEFITLPNNLCYFQNDYVSFDLGTEKQINYIDIAVTLTISDSTSQEIQFEHSQESLSIYY